MTNNETTSTFVAYEKKIGKRLLKPLAPIFRFVKSELLGKDFMMGSHLLKG